LEYAGYDQPADEVWPNMPDVLQAAEVFFGLSDGGKALFADGSPTLYTF